MYIQSKLKQLRKDLFKIDTSEIEKSAILKEEQYELTGSWGAANSHIVYGNGFAVINSQFEANIDLTDVLPSRRSTFSYPVL